MSFDPRASIRHCTRLAWLLLISLICGGVTATAYPDLDVPYVPTPPEVVNRMLEMAEVRPDDYLVDLGSGDGRIVITAVRDWKVKQALGVDLDPRRVAEARSNASKVGVSDRAKFRQADLFETDFSEATVLTMYLLQTVNERLRPEILKNLAPGTRVVSHAFDMGEWRPEKTDVVSGRNIYMWIVPARVQGRWQITTTDGERIPVSLTQAYQKFQGTAMVNGGTEKLEDTALRGNMITFVIGSDRYTGIVNGDTIEQLETENTTQNWVAHRVAVS